MKFEVRVKSIKKTTVDSDAVSDESTWKMVAQTAMGYPKITITKLEPFGGIRPGEYVTVNIDTPQTTLDITNPEDNAEEHKQAMIEGLKPKVPRKAVKPLKKGKK